MGQAAGGLAEVILPYSVYLDSIEEDAERIGVTTLTGLRAKIVSCPGWTLADLVVHLAGVYHRFAAQVRAGTPDVVVPVEPLAQDAPLEVLESATEEIVAALRARDPEAPCWNFVGEDLTTGFVARRLAQETAIHRVDAQLTGKAVEPIERELAVDGIDERLDVMLRHGLRRVPDADLGGSICLVCEDDPAAWTVEVHRGELRLRHGRSPAGAVLVGEASDLYCFTWNRPTRQRLKLTGERNLPDAWAALGA